MILVDTSAWVVHLKHAGGEPTLIRALEQGVAAAHPFVEGELLLAGTAVEELLGGVTMLPMAPHVEVREFVDGLPKPVRRVGWVDAHLVYSALIHRCDLLTHDRAQRELFERCRRPQPW